MFCICSLNQADSRRIKHYFSADGGGGAVPGAGWHTRLAGQCWPVVRPGGDVLGAVACS
jgi:hypothetical protein